MQCNLRAGDGIQCMKVAYDEELAAHSPGMQLEVASLELFEQDRRAAWMDSCAAPDNELINRLWPERTTIRTLILPTGLVGRTSARATAAALSVARRAWRGIF
jgi:CelD/BcsL family acetyltransferase involved in cellulose biosynthesis